MFMFYKNIFFFKKIIKSEFSKLTLVYATNSYCAYTPNNRFEKKNFFTSIKGFFLFSNNTVLFLKNVYLYKYLDFYLFNGNLDTEKIFEKKQNELKCSFFFPKKILRDSRKINAIFLKNVFSSFFLKKLMKFTKYTNEFLYTNIINIRSALLFIFNINTNNNYLCVSNYVTVYLNNSRLIKSDYFSIKSGDCVKISFSDKYVKHIYSTFLKKYNFFSKKKLKLPQIGKLSFTKINELHSTLIQENAFTKNFEVSFISLNFIFLNTYCILKYNTILKNLINLYSWRLYDWSFEVR